MGKGEVEGGRGRGREGGVSSCSSTDGQMSLFCSPVLSSPTVSFSVDLISLSSSAPQPAAHSFVPQVKLCCEMGATILAGTQNLVEALIPSLSYRLPVRV